MFVVFGSWVWQASLGYVHYKANYILKSYKCTFTSTKCKMILRLWTYATAIYVRMMTLAISRCTESWCDGDVWRSARSKCCPLSDMFTVSRPAEKSCQHVRNSNCGVDRWDYCRPCVALQPWHSSQVVSVLSPVFTCSTCKHWNISEFVRVVWCCSAFQGITSQNVCH